MRGIERKFGKEAWKTWAGAALMLAGTTLMIVGTTLAIPSFGVSLAITGIGAGLLGVGTFLTTGISATESLTSDLGSIAGKLHDEIAKQPSLTEGRITNPSKHSIFNEKPGEPPSSSKSEEEDDESPKP